MVRSEIVEAFPYGYARDVGSSKTLTTRNSASNSKEDATSSPQGCGAGHRTTRSSQTVTLFQQTERESIETTVSTRGVSGGGRRSLSAWAIIGYLSGLYVSRKLRGRGAAWAGGGQQEWADCVLEDNSGVWDCGGTGVPSLFTLGLGATQHAKGDED